MKRPPLSTLAVATVILACVAAGCLLFQKAMAKTEAIVLVKERVLSPAYLREWVKEQEAEGPLEVKGWGVVQGDREGTFIVSFIVKRKATESRPGGEEGFWFRVDCASETIEPVQPKGSGY